MTLQWVTDGGLETDLLFHQGIELAEFASFPLVESAAGRRTLLNYYRGYAGVAAAAGAGLVLETPTWRANTGWGPRLGYDVEAIARVNRAAVELLRELAPGTGDVRISGNVGPLGDGYQPGQHTADAAAELHRPQVRALAEAGVDVVHAMTLTGVAEALGVVQVAREAGVEVGISFLVETDGRLPDGTTLRTAVEQLDAEAAPDWYGVNCAHPTHMRPAFDGGEWQDRIRCLRPNASTLSHAELDEMEELDEGDLQLLTSSTSDLLALLPTVTTLGGCCGTDVRHVAALWGVPSDGA